MTRAPRHRALEPGAEEAARAEVEHHIAELAERLTGEGWTSEEAEAEARRRFGDPERYRDRLERTERQRRRSMKRTEAWGVVRSVVIQTARTARRSPGYAAGVALTLALGVGANAAMFGILDRLLFQPPMHVIDHESVKRVMIERSFVGRPTRSVSMAFPDFEDFQRVEGFSQVAALTGPREATLGRGEDAERIRTLQSSHDLFPLLGVRPALGRFYGSDDDRLDASGTVVLGHEYWERRFGGDADVLGRTLEIGGKSYQVIGVAPRGFTGVDLAPVDAWLPIRVASRDNGCIDTRDCTWLTAVARIAPGADPGVVAEQSTAAHRAGRSEHIEAGFYDPEVRVALDPLIEARGPEASAEAKVARWLGGVSLVVLLIACANVANLLLARGTRRRREVSLRLALGAERARVIGTLVGESVLLALAGAAIAVAFAGWGGALIRRLLLPGVHFPDPPVSGRLIAFAALAAVAAGAAAAIGPAFQSTRTDLSRELTGSMGTAGRRSRVRALLTAGQAALAVVLLAGAGLFVRSVAEVRRLDLGMDADRLALVTLELEGATGFLSGGGSADRTALYTEAAARLRAVPGVVAAAGTTSPFQWAFGLGVRVEGWDSLPDLPGGGPYYHLVTEDYFRTVGLDVVEGRPLGSEDGAGSAPVVVINRTMARTVWPEGDAVGSCVFISPADTGGADPDAPERCVRVVGVAQDASRGGLQEDAYMALYLPFAQAEGGQVNGLYVRTEGPAVEAAGALAAALRGFDPAVRYANVRPLRDVLDPQARSWTLGASMFTVFGLLALLVASIGLYSVLAFDVAQSTKEIGIRTALGAERARVLRAVVWRGMGMAALGVAVGLGVTVLAAPYAADLLFQVSPRDPAVLGGVAATLLVVAALASLLPGLRATRVDAMQALRGE